MSERWRKAAAWGGAAALALLVGTVWAWAPEDDLAIVKRAVADSQATAVPEGPPTKASPPAARKEEPQWLKMRIVEKTGKKARVSVNLPLALVRAVGDDWPIDWHCGREGKEHRRCSIRIGEVLGALEAGQQLVEIESEDATVRVWVE